MRSGWKSSNCLKTKRGFGLLPRRRAVQRCLARAALFRRLADAFIGLPENLGGLHSCARGFAWIRSSGEESKAQSQPVSFLVLPDTVTVVLMVQSAMRVVGVSVSW